jgi:hypothetical protein
MKPSQIIIWQNFKDRLSSTALANLKTIIFIITLLFIAAFFVLNWIFINTLKNQYRDLTGFLPRYSRNPNFPLS